MYNGAMKLRERAIKRKRVYAGRSVGLRADTVRLPNGKTAVREFLEHPGAVAVLPVLPGGRTILVRQYRHPVGRATWEIPAGKLDPGESPAVCVRRELEEETGCRARSIRKILSYWPTPAFGNEVIHIYVATGIARGRARLDEDEFLQSRVWRIRDARRWIRAGRIMDSKTVIAFLAYDQWVARRGSRR